MKVDKSKARTPDEEYWYWLYKQHNLIDWKLPWDMHPNELRASDMYKKKIEKKIHMALELIAYEEHNN